jgi:hypothetical protein
MKVRVNKRDLLGCWQWWLVLVICLPYLVALLPFRIAGLFMFIAKVLEEIFEAAADALFTFDRRCMVPIKARLERPAVVLIRWAKKHVKQRARLRMEVNGEKKVAE